MNSTFRSSYLSYHISAQHVWKMPLIVHIVDNPHKDGKEMNTINYAENTTSIFAYCL